MTDFVHFWLNYCFKNTTLNMMIAVVSNMNIADAYLSSPSSLVFAFDLSLFLAILHQHAVYICISLSL